MLRLVAVLTVFPFVALNASEIFKEMHFPPRYLYIVFNSRAKDCYLFCKNRVVTVEVLNSHGLTGSSNSNSVCLLCLITR